ncbi:hypothetical protein QNN03_36625 [Streptomyces sp. GXMU-J15]|uniref:VWA domain-containing protein n=1 Tax=Streptomyces fuscus TaxID=3048495 RepID=A0ABT7JAZ3_9ACTN|nr:hypothetical protein [Streptomyces fuscus]MDL2081965.1 hypothetical protein [Streptomyces fuscus]
MRITKKTTRVPRRYILLPRGGRPAVAIALAVAATVTGCNVSSSPHGQLAQDQAVLKSCDASAPPAADIHIDGSASSNSQAITEERLAAVEEIVRRTAICSGRVRVSVFSASSAATTTLFDGSLPLHGATENARLKRVPTVVGDAMAKIRDAYDPAVAGLKGKGSDIAAQYRLASEWANQVGNDYKLRLVILTDGFQTVGVDLYKTPLTKRKAAALAAARTTVPELTGASVTVAGLGRVGGEPPRSDVVEGLVAYYTDLCEKTKAAKCLSVTDYATEGR